LALPNSAATVSERALGCREAIGASGLPCAKVWMEIGDPGEISFVGELIERHAPDAFVCANDFTAAKLMTTLNVLGLSVPTQIKVTGMDDIRYASMLQTPLTTIHQPCMELGAAAMAAMLERIAHPDTPVRDCLVNFQLVVRQSTFAGALPDTRQGEGCDEMQVEERANAA
jgi:DNA-binding LacI/PurR family transcriptional regulator